MTKPAWVDHHLVLNIKSIAAQTGVQLESSTDSLHAKAVRLVNGWRQDMLAKGSEMEFTQAVPRCGDRLLTVSCG